MFAVELRTQNIRSQSRCKCIHSVSALVAWSKLHSFQLIYSIIEKVPPNTYAAFANNQTSCISWKRKHLDSHVSSQHISRLLRYCPKSLSNGSWLQLCVAMEMMCELLLAIAAGGSLGSGGR